jgi:hypothetical protein
MVIAWSSAVTAVEFGSDISVRLADGTVHVHRRSVGSWDFETGAGRFRHTTTLGDTTAVAELAETSSTPAAVERSSLVLRVGRPTTIDLTEQHYRRSEQSWKDAGLSDARLTLAIRGDALHLSVEVPTSDLTFASADAVNQYDNEHPEINGDGVQLYVRSDMGLSGWMLIPDRDSSDVRIRRLEGWLSPESIHATWQREGNGYRVNIELASIPFALDLVVNEMPRGRARRRGQLVLSGANGEFVYLRGDRHDAIRLVPLTIDND